MNMPQTRVPITITSEAPYMHMPATCMCMCTDHLGGSVAGVEPCDIAKRVHREPGLDL